MIKFKKTELDSQLPKRATDGSAGFDLHHAGYSTVLEPGERQLFKTGIICELQPEKVGIIKPRSGWALKYGVDVMAGVIDSDYRDEIGVILINHGKEPLHIYTGDRIAQLVVVDFEWQSTETERLSETKRGAGGFGSTGIK